MCSQEREQLELLRSQMDRLSIEAELVRHEVEFVAAGHLQAGCGSRPGSLFEEGSTIGQLDRIDCLWQRFIESGAQGGDP